MTLEWKLALDEAQARQEAKEREFKALLLIPEAKKLAADIDKRVSIFRAGQFLRTKHATLYGDPVNGHDLENAIDEDIKNAIHGFDGFSGKAS